MDTRMQGSSDGYSFGAFLVLPRERLLLRSGRPVRIGSRAFDLLCLLCERAGEVLPKDQLISAVWGSRVVEEGNLRVHMTALRKALDDGHAGHRYVANIPLRGYSLVTPVRRIGPGTVSGDGMAASGNSGNSGNDIRVDNGIVHIVDDDQSLREALDSLFRSVGMATRLYAAPQEFMTHPSSHVPGCIVLDIRLPGMSGLDFQAHLVGENVTLPVVFMTGYGDIPMCAQAMKSGAVDFLAKPFRDQDMLDAVGRAIEIDRVRKAENQDRSSLHLRYQTLSPREREVMELVTGGSMNKQVAAALGLQEITVKIHRGNAMKKMGAKTLADLVRMTTQLGMDRGSKSA